MRSIATMCVMSALLLCGCGGTDTDAGQPLEDKITALEARVRTLEENLQQTRLDLAAKQNEVDRLEENLRTLATIVDKTTVRLDRVDRR